MTSLSLSDLRRRLKRLGGVVSAVAVMGLAASPPVALAETGRPPPKLERITVDGLVPYHRAEKPITNAEGRIRVIVDLMDEATERYLEAARPLIERFDPKRDRHNPQALMAIEAFERRHGIEPEFQENERGERVRSNVTSWVGASVTAYLTAGQIEAIRRDPDVRLVTEDRAAKFSSDPPWWPSWNGNPWTELRDWGAEAVGTRAFVSKEPPGDNVSVWLIDSGVAFHEELESVSRMTVGGGTVVGSFAHATHVAGIIGAKANNAQGRVGIYSLVPIVSMKGPDYTGGHSIDSISTALDLIYVASLVQSPQIGRPNVVNMSINPHAHTGFSPVGVAQTNQPKIAHLAVPRLFNGLHYPGNVFVQSAGNFFADSCSNWPLYNPNDPEGPRHEGTLAFKPWAGATSAAPDDGVLVVGAVNQYGAVAAPFSAAYPLVANADHGSSFGACIDIWAPGDFIYSTWGEGAYDTDTGAVYSGGQPEACALMSCASPPHRGWAWLSGTSMAAPHVAAVAAYVIQQMAATTPAQVESVLRAGAQQLPSGLPLVRMP
jgi:hypothetical protein